MTRIPVPAWARRPETWLERMRLSDYDAILRSRDGMLAAVHAEVETYLNTPGLYFDTDEGFPNRARLTGEYYIADESYRMHTKPVWFQIGISCRCLERPREVDQSDLAYLGLEVWLRYDPEESTYHIFRNTDSSSI